MRVVHILAISYICAYVLFFSALFVRGMWENSHRIAPGPENQSSFLKTYDPDGVIESFRITSKVRALARVA